MKPYKMRIILATLCMVVATGMNMAGPWAVRSLIQLITDGVSGQVTIDRVSLLAGAVVLIYVMRAFSRFGTDYISHYAAWNMLEDIRKHLYDHVQKLPLRYFQDKQTGDLMSRVMDDTRNFEQLLAHAIPTLVVNALTFVGIMAVLIAMNATLALYTMIPMPLLAVMVIRFSSISRPLFRRAQERVGEVNAVLQDNFTGVKEIKAFTQEEYETARTGRTIAGHTRAILRALRLSNAFHPGIEFVAGIGTVIVIFFGGRLALGGALPLEDLVAFLMYLSLFYQPIMALGQINEGLQHAMASADRVYELLREPPEVMEEPGAQEIVRARGLIEFRNVSFRYVDSIPVLEDVSFTIQPGQTLAIIGVTGVGKTTIANLIPRFYEATQGEIRLDGERVGRYTLTSLRRQISLVSQDVFLFNGTVKGNILYGCPDASDEEVIRAATAAGAHEFIKALEHGYETRVGERGVKLSGGQKQRISIARAVLKDAPILILDEATSAVDTQTEQIIQDAIGRLKRNKTAVVIAHRLSTIREADRIIVLRDGRIAEQGSHEDLMGMGGLYSRLCRAQSAGAQI